MSAEQWIMLAVSGIVIPTVGWLVKEIVSLRKDFVGMQVRHEEREKAVDLAIDGITANCTRHQKWGEDMSKTVGRMDRNIVRLCAEKNVSYEEE